MCVNRPASYRLQVSGSKVHMNDLKVVYSNGEPDDIPVRSEIRADKRELSISGASAEPSRQSK